MNERKKCTAKACQVMSKLLLEEYDKASQKNFISKSYINKERKRSETGRYSGKNDAEKITSFK